MILQFLSVVLLVPGQPPGDWKFVDESTHDGRSVLAFRSVELSESPLRPLHRDDKPPAGSKFGSVALSPGGSLHLNVVWHEKSGAFWFDADGDGRFADSERHLLGDKAIEVKVKIPFGDGITAERTLLFRKRGDGVAWAVRGYTMGTVTIQGKKMAAMLTDGDADGCFDGAGADRIWLDLDGNGKLDALSEQFPLGSAISIGGTSILFRPRPDGLGVQARERPNENGKISVEIIRESKRPIVDFSAGYVSEFGELVVVRSMDSPVELPAGKYRLDSLQLSLMDAEGKVWQYSFSESGRVYDIEVKKGKLTVHRPLDGLKLTVTLGASGAAPGDSANVQPNITAGDLYMNSCTVTDKFSSYPRGALAEIVLMETGSVVVDQCESGFM